MTDAWILRLVAALQQHEDEHGTEEQGWHCLAGPLDAVPPAVLEQARGYAQAKREATDGG